MVFGCFWHVFANVLVQAMQKRNEIRKSIEISFEAQTQQSNLSQVLVDSSGSAEGHGSFWCLNFSP